MVLCLFQEGVVLCYKGSGGGGKGGGGGGGCCKYCSQSVTVEEEVLLGPV